MNDELLRRIASEYVNQSGAELRRELDEIDQLAQSGVTRITPALDMRVFSRIRAQKRARYRRIGGLVAACIALALLAPMALRPTEQDGAPSADISSAGTVSPTVSASAPAQADEAPAEYEIIPLSATLPERFTVSAAELDVEKTIYYIEDAELDDIVMTLQYADDLEMLRELSPVMIGAYTAYGRVEPGYSLLAFEKDGVLYILTCEHDLSTLIELANCILI